MPSPPSEIKFFVNTRQETLEKQKLKLSRSALFHTETTVSLKYLVNDNRNPKNLEWRD